MSKATEFMKLLEAGSYYKDKDGEDIVCKCGGERFKRKGDDLQCEDCGRMQGTGGDFEMSESTALELQKKLIEDSKDKKLNELVKKAFIHHPDVEKLGVTQVFLGVGKISGRKENPRNPGGRKQDASFNAFAVKGVIPGVGGDTNIEMFKTKKQLVARAKELLRDK